MRSLFCTYPGILRFSLIRQSSCRDIITRMPLTASCYPVTCTIRQTMVIDYRCAEVNRFCLLHHRIISEIPIGNVWLFLLEKTLILPSMASSIFEQIPKGFGSKRLSENSSAWEPNLLRFPPLRGGCFSGSRNLDTPYPPQGGNFQTSSNALNRDGDSRLRTS